MKKRRKISLSSITAGLVVGIVFVTLCAVVFIFLSVYRDATVKNTLTSSEQAVVQVSNTVGNYAESMREVLELIKDCYEGDSGEREETLSALLKVRPEVVAVISYGEEGGLKECWSGQYALKEKLVKDLSYMEDAESGERLYLSKPHVESLLRDYYPWVVSLMQKVELPDGEVRRVVMDIRFSQMANYVDEVGIGQHGYCYIVDTAGNIVYHPQQQLIYSGLKTEEAGKWSHTPDGSFVENDSIYCIRTLDNCNWRIVGVSYIEENVNAQIMNAIGVLTAFLLIVLFTALLSSFILSRTISRPIQQLIQAMGEFEKNAAQFTFSPVHGSSEIEALTQSFGHMVVRIQELMNKVRQEEITLRKTELKALQAQINPHFLYNTLDAIGWMCEEERSREAVEMVNALAKLFRISISKGHELIPIGKEVEHATSYLKIEQVRFKKFTYTWDIDERCLSYYCNKITLQPIIENAIYHGLGTMVDDGAIRIGIRQEGGDILFTVEDNGIGMSREQCYGILHKEAGDSAGIGIKNVDDRIKIYFGEKYGITIESELDEGTCVTIRMPKVTEEDYDGK